MVCNIVRLDVSSHYSNSTFMSVPNFEIFSKGETDSIHWYQSLQRYFVFPLLTFCSRVQIPLLLLSPVPMAKSVDYGERGP